MGTRKKEDVILMEFVDGCFVSYVLLRRRLELVVRSAGRVISRHRISATRVLLILLCPFGVNFILC
jgi:hypothetical protein